MWKAFTLSIFFLASFSSVTAQNSLYVGLRGSFQASTANLSHTIFGTSVSTSQVFGLSTGVIVKYFPKEQLGLQFEANYSQKGFQQLLSDTGEVFETNLDYLEFPVMFNVYLGRRKTQYFANFGPFVAVVLNDNTQGPGNSVSEELTFLYDADRDSKFATGLKVGVGIFRQFAFGGLQVDAHLAADISNFLNPVDLSIGVPDNSQNLVLGVSLAYLLPFGQPFDHVE